MSRDKIRARVAAATEGPWEVVDLIGSRPAAASVWTAEAGELDVCLSEEACPADAQFIAHARQDIPALLAVADAAAKVAAVSYPLTQASVGPRPEDNGAWSNNLRLSDMDDLRAALASLEALP